MVALLDAYPPVRLDKVKLGVAAGTLNPIPAATEYEIPMISRDPVALIGDRGVHRLNVTLTSTIGTAAAL